MACCLSWHQIPYWSGLLIANIRKYSDIRRKLVFKGILWSSDKLEKEQRTRFGRHRNNDITPSVLKKISWPCYLELIALRIRCLIFYSLPSPKHQKKTKSLPLHVPECIFLFSWSLFHNTRFLM